MRMTVLVIYMKSIYWGMARFVSAQVFRQILDTVRTFTQTRPFSARVILLRLSLTGHSRYKTAHYTIRAYGMRRTRLIRITLPGHSRKQAAIGQNSVPVATRCLRLPFYHPRTILSARIDRIILPTTPAKGLTFCL